MGKWVDTGTEISVYSLLYAAADRADMLKDDGAGNLTITDFANQEAMVAYLDYELAALWDLLIASHEDYLVYRRFVDVVANQEDYALPEDFYKFRKVFPIVGGKRCRPLRKFNLEKLGDADSLAAIYTSQIEDTQYRISGSRLWLHPAPTNNVTHGLELWYVPQFHLLRNQNDLIPHVFPNGWEEYAIEGVAARLLEKEESDASAQRGRQQQILQRIMILAEDRDVGEPHQLQDTEGVFAVIDPLETQHTGQQEIERQQENIKKFAKPLEDNPLLDGHIVEDVAFDGAVDTTFNHGLGRQPLGCFPVDWETGATMAIAFGRSAMDANTITAFADVACTLQIWVY